MATRPAKLLESLVGRPALVHGVLARRRLFERLDRGVEGPATLISAPAGSGKTQLVASWLEDATVPGPVAWVSVEPGEQDGMRFWGNVVRALQVSGAAKGAEALLALRPTPRVGAETFVRRLREGLAALADPVVLIIDDLHELQDPEAVERLAALVAYRLPTLRVVLISRRDPAIGLHRLRLSGELTEIRGADLDFNTEEVGELVAHLGLGLGDQSVATLRDRTEGWAAGLRLALSALAAVSDRESFVEQLSGTERTIADYLLREVLERESRGVQRLLVRTSVLQRVNGALADKLTGRRDGRRVLRELAEANALVQSLDVGRSWFRYHPMLGDFLRDQLESDPAEDVEELHRSAAQWYAENGLIVDAIRHAEAGHDLPRAVDLLMGHVFTLFLDGQAATLHEFVEPLVDHATDDAEAAALLAVDRLINGVLDEAAAYLASAERLAASVPEPRRRRLDAVVATTVLYLARGRGDFEGALNRARPVLCPADGEALADVVSNEDLRAMALMHLGIVELWARRLADAEEHLTAALELARRIGRPYIALGCLGPLAEVAQMMAAPKRAKQHATEAIAIAEQIACADGPVAAVAHSALGSVLTAEGRLDDAAASLERAARGFKGTHDVEAAVVLHFRLALVRYGQGRYAEAFESAREADWAHERIGSPHYLGDFLATLQLRAAMRLGDTLVVRRALEALDAERRGAPQWRSLAADVYLTEGDPQAAVEELAPLLDGSAVLMHVGEEVQALLLEAVARDAMDQREEAERAIERALALGERQAWLSIAISTPMAVPLLRRHPRARSRHGSYLAEVLDRLGERPALTLDPVSPGLSERELQVLRLLPTNLRSAEIASELMVSVHTAKSHMRKIYAKLGAHRRTEAVDRARALGLLPPTHTNRAISK